MKKFLTCPSCQGKISVYANPLPTADILIHEPGRGVVIIARKNPPLGFALPGGFVDEGEWFEHAALREAKEETGDNVLKEFTKDLTEAARSGKLVTARALDPAALQASDDALSAIWADPELPPVPMCFDHGRMLLDYVEVLQGRRPLGALSAEWLQTEEGQRNQQLMAAVCRGQQ